MTLVAYCIACNHGAHDLHRAVPAHSLPGLIGSGQTCPCKGECVDRRREPIIPSTPRRGGHGLPPVDCALCQGDGDACNPGNADPAVKVSEWLYPVVCPRCGGTGDDPNP